MSKLSPNELKMFDKWLKVPRLHMKDEFWDDVLNVYNDRVMTLPLIYNPYAVRTLMERLHCPPGKCGACCTDYDQVSIQMDDLQRIARNTDYDMPYLVGLFKNTITSQMYIPTTGGCPFLKNNVCTVYRARPNVCYFYPLQPPQEILTDGTNYYQQVELKLKCRPAIDLARSVLEEALGYEDKDGTKLLPDLSIVRYEK